MGISKTMGIGCAFGKIILMGEHAVVYGKPALAIPFRAVSVKTTITEITGPIQLDCIFYQGNLDHVPINLTGLRVTIEATLKELNQSLGGLHIHINSTIPPKRGMGSSAAVSVATIRGLYDFFGVYLSKEQLLTLTDLSEKIAHGNPSGLDAAVTSGNVPLYYIKGQAFTPFSIRINAYLIVADTGMTGETITAVQGVSERMKHNTECTKELINQLGSLSIIAKHATESNDPELLGEKMSEAHEILNHLGVSNERLNHFVYLSVQTGALGAKLTGGGRGGCMIALASNEMDAKRIQSVLLEAGAAKTWMYKMGDE